MDRLRDSVIPPPLDGLVVLDLSRVLAGPYCTMILGDLGAEVIKIEHPSGDETRRWGPPFAGGESAYYLAVNRNKRSAVADLKTAEGASLVRRIAARADVLVENFRPGAMARFGLELGELRERNPRLITLSLSGMGATGPDRHRGGYDFVIQALGGLMSITGPEQGPPSKVGVAIADLTTGMMAAVAVLAALQSRTVTGLGQHIDISLLETQVSWLANVASAYLTTGEEPSRFGNAHHTIVPYQTFDASDGPFALAVGNDAQWQRLCAAIGRPDLAADQRFRTNPDRVLHRETLVRELAAHFRTSAKADWTARLAAADVPIAAVRTVAEVFADPQIHARDMVLTVPHPTIGELRMVGIPFKFSASPAAVRRPPPLLGEHTAEILDEYPPPP